MRILITGAAGTLGSALAPILDAGGYDPVLADIAPIDTRYEFVLADVRQRDQIAAALSGIDVVVHAAAIHGIHLHDHRPQDFYELNLTGTFSLWEAAIAAGVRAFVFCSTMGVYGESRSPAGDDVVMAVREDLPLVPTDIYGYTKLAGEQMSRLYGRTHGIPSIALRFGMFVPEPFFRYGIRLLYGGVHADDAAHAVLAAVDTLLARRIEWDAFNVHSPLPFDVSARELRHDPLAALDRWYPRAPELLRERGVERLNPIDSYFPVERIGDQLGFRPRHDFGAWLDELRRRPSERSPAPIPWP